MRTIVLGYDGSDAAEHALGRAAEIAERFAARVVVLAVGPSTLVPMPEPVPEPVDPSLVPAGRTPPLPRAMPKPTAPTEPEEPMWRQLERARAVRVPRGIEADYVSAVGDPAETLLEAADEHDADLIVVGSREHSLLERLLGGGVDQTLARRARRDVLLVR